MVILFTRKYEEDPLKNEPIGMLARLYINFSDAQGQVTPPSLVESNWNSNSVKL